MSRAAALVLVVAVLLLSGVWSARRQAAEEDAAAAASEAQRVAAVDDDRADEFAPVSPLGEERRLVFDAPESVLREDVDYRAVLRTSRGDLVVDLFEERAPRTVNNFVFLALHRYYDGVPFHRVLEGFMAQTGDPTGTGTGGPGYTFEDEIHPDLRHDRAGTLSMANAGPGTNGSQFFITFDETPWLDGQYAVFGQVIEGLEVLDALTRVDPEAPQVVAHLDEPLAGLAAQDIDVPDDPERTVASYLRAELGALPVRGQSFPLAGRRAVLGTFDGQEAIGLFPVPDVLESVTVLASGAPAAADGEADADSDPDADPDAPSEPAPGRAPGGGFAPGVAWATTHAPGPIGAATP